MDKELHSAREDYKLSSLDVNQVQERPLEQFKQWFSEYKELGNKDYNAMLLTTVKSDGGPASRIVLLKSIAENGLDFFTNYNSNKGQEMANNPKVALTFFWQSLERQIRIEGEAVKLSDKESDAYFKVRPRGSQIGAWVSPQSETIANRAFLEERTAFFEDKFQGQDIPRPEHWGGYRVIPNKYEFWQGRSNRLHDRIIYMQEGGAWKIERLAP